MLGLATQYRGDLYPPCETKQAVGRATSAVELSREKSESDVAGTGRAVSLLSLFPKGDVTVCRQSCQAGRSSGVPSWQLTCKK
jgi:hypothetical protein